MTKTDRRQIKVVSVSGWKLAGRSKVLSFVGEDRVTYETWDTSIGDMVKPGAILDAGVVFSETEKDGVKYFNNQVIQVYVDGKPVKLKPLTTDDREDQRTRMTLIMELWIEGKLFDEHPLVLGLMEWLEKKEVKEVPEIGKSKFRNQGDFLNACYMNYKLTKSQVMEILKGSDITELTQVSGEDAWVIIQKSQEK